MAISASEFQKQFGRKEIVDLKPIGSTQMNETIKELHKPTKSRGSALNRKPATNKVNSELSGSGFEEYDHEFEAITKRLHLPDFLHCAFGNRFVQLTDKQTLAKMLLIRLPEPGFDIHIEALKEDGFTVTYIKKKSK
ncbi:MAG: hypothetical protein V4714_17670 [Bacteroidota bacterium]